MKELIIAVLIVAVACSVAESRPKDKPTHHRVSVIYLLGKNKWLSLNFLTNKNDKLFELATTRNTV